MKSVITAMFVERKAFEYIKKSYCFSLVLVLNNDLRDIVKYCEENELFLNFKKGKTEVMLLGTAQRMKRHGHQIEIIHNGSK